MRALRVAMVGSRGIPATFGGVERHVEELGLRLAERGHEVIVYCRPNYTDAGLSDYRGMRLIRVPTIATKHLEAFVHSGLSALHALTAGVDVVHFHALGPGLFAPLPRYLSRAAVVQTVHGMDDERAKWSGGAQRVLALGGWLSARVPHETITVSRALAERYLATAGRPCTYIPNGAPLVTPRRPKEIVSRFGLRGRDYVLWVGRIVPEKAPDQLIRAFRAVRTDARLVIVGGSSFTDGYSALVRQLAAEDPRVVMTGYAYGTVLEELYSNAGLYVQPSLLEGLPLTLLEASAYGLPVVVSDIGPHAEVLGASRPGQWIFPVGDEQALTTAITEALRDVDAAREGAARLRERVRVEYSWDDVADRTQQLYQRLLDGGRRPSGSARVVAFPRQRSGRTTTSADGRGAERTASGPPR